MMGDQSAQQGVGMLDVAQVPGAIELVQASEGKAGGVADVVQPGGGFQQIGVRAEGWRQAACPRGDALDMCPAVGRKSWRSAWARCSAHEASWFMRLRLSRQCGTFNRRDRVV